MRYGDVVEGIFLQRMNRFVAWVRVNGAGVRCHVKNTGRLKELFVSGARCVLAVADNPNRATAYDLVGIWRGDVLVNVDSQAPNAAAREWVSGGGLGGGVTLVKPEYAWGKSRFDLYAERHLTGEEKPSCGLAADGEEGGRHSDVSAGKQGEANAPGASAAGGREGTRIPEASAMQPPVERMLIEVKGVTLNVDGEARFPDAPTARGVKHVRELIEAKRQGYRACIVFVIQMPDADAFAPNDATHPEFGEALRDAARAGVEIHAVRCRNAPDSMVMTDEVPVRLEAPAMNGWGGKSMIVEIDRARLAECLRVIHRGYEPTAIRFGLTGENCPYRGRADLPLSVLADELSSGSEMYGYCVENRIVGFVSIVVGRAEIKINDIVVLPECWNQGVGSALLEFVRRRAVEANVSKIALGMIDDNERLRNWYEAHGFVNVGYRQYPKAPFRVGYMERTLE